LAAALVVAPSASASFGFKALDFSITGTQAGAHPAEVITAFEMNTVVNESETLEFPDGQLRHLDVDLPEGFAGNPGAVPACDPALFITAVDAHPSCPNSSVVGYTALKAEFDPIEPNVEGAFYHFALYNLPPSPGYAAKIGFLALGVPVTVDLGVRESPPYGVYAHLTNASEAALLFSSEVRVWGDPANPVHDSLRGSCLNAQLPSEFDEPLSTGSCPAGIAEEDRIAFLTSPRSCEGPLVAAFAGVAWNTGATDTDSTTVPGREGCEELEFEAQASAEPTSSAAESPSGLTFELGIEDEGLLDPDEEALALSDIKRTEVLLPEGVTINPSQANGLGVCTEGQLAKETATSEFGDGCPAAAKVGNVEVETPLLEGKTLKGSLFVAEPYKNPFGSLIALYMVIKDKELGVSVKLPAKVSLDPVTGRVATTFGDPSAKDPLLRALPQLPLGSVRVNLPGGPRSPLVTPPRCGSYEITSIFTPWANPDEPLETTSGFEITSGPGGAPCPGEPPFAPGFDAGTLDNTAGSFSPLYMRLTRNDTEAELTRLSATLPSGLVAKLAGVAQCSEAALAAADARSGSEELASPSCPASSRIGTITSGAGVGSELTWVDGTLYLAGPVGGHPLSVAAVVPAVAGPFDLGVVVVREGLDLNPITAQGEIDGSVSAIPTILEGVPLRLRDLRINVDRPQFALNPTSCEEKQIQALALATSLAAPLSRRFQARGCEALGFKPKLSLALKGGTKRGMHPSVRSVLVPRPGDANIGSATVLLPPLEFIDNAHISNPCTRVQFGEGTCPKTSILGHAKAFTPLLDAPLEGPVYFRSNGGERELPDVVADLHGQFRIILVGFVDSKNGRVRTRFQSVPDAPVSKFLLRLKGGSQGLLVNNRNICKGKLHATLRLGGQNGKRHDTTPVVKTSCKKKSKRPGHP